nr:L-glyceraldehyde 3-phosphate reductase [uncultured Sphaerochaeta sp.]
MYKPNPERYDSMLYNRCGKSGLKLPAISLGLWHNYGDTTSLANSRKMLHTAFDLGITHFDLANNYGPPPGSAELNFGKLLAQDFAAYRDELIISTKAGYRMWPGIYGEWGSRKYVLASLDQSLKRLGLDYVDIFYSHRFDPDTPLEETMGALASAYKAGKCLYVGISSYSAAKTKAAYEILASMDVPLLIHQPSYSMLNRWVEESLLDTLNTLGVGTICFSPLAQGMLSDRYLKEIPEGSRAAKSGSSLSQELLTEQNLKNIHSLNEIALSRGQSLPQMALAWCLRRKEITSVLIGASSPEQIVENVGSLQNLSFSQEELAAIDSYAKEGGINLWARSSKD